MALSPDAFQVPPDCRGSRGGGRGRPRGSRRAAPRRGDGTRSRVSPVIVISVRNEARRPPHTYRRPGRPGPPGALPEDLLPTALRAGEDESASTLPAPVERQVARSMVTHRRTLDSPSPVGFVYSAFRRLPARASKHGALPVFDPPGVTRLSSPAPCGRDQGSRRVTRGPRPGGRARSATRTRPSEEPCARGLSRWA